VEETGPSKSSVRRRASRNCALSVSGFSNGCHHDSNSTAHQGGVCVYGREGEDEGEGGEEGEGEGEGVGERKGEREREKGSGRRTSSASGRKTK
jgi:hypothetical protein